MNGPRNTATERYLGDGDENPAPHKTVVTGVETAHVAAGVAQPSSNPFTEGYADAGAARQASNGNAGAFSSLRDGIAGLGIGKGRGTSRSKSPASAKQPMEVEMQ